MNKALLDRLFSFALVFTLVFGLIPFDFNGTAGAAGVSQTIDFTIRSDTWINPISGAADDMRYIPKEHTDGSWSFFEYTPGMWVSQTSFRQYKNDYMHALMVDAGDWVALRIELAEGRYNTRLNYYYWTKAGAADIYLLPGDTAAADITDAIADNEYIIGDVDCYGTGWVKADKPLDDLTVPETGEYLLVFKLTGATGGANHLYLRQLIFEPAQAKLSQIEASCSPSAIKAGRKAEITVSGLLEDGNAANLSRAQITYTALDPEYATVSGTGVITALSAGEAAFNVSVTLDGTTVTGECTLSVIEGGPDTKSGAKVNINLSYIAESWVNPISGSNLDVRGISYDMTDGNWAFHGNSPGMTLSISSFRVYRNNYFEPTLPEVGNWVSLKIQIPAAGTYTPTLNYFEYGNSCDGDVYILPIDTQDITDSVKNELYKLGEVNCHGPAWVEKSVVLDDFHAPEAGEYLLVFKSRNVDTGAYLWIKNLILDGLYPLGQVSASVSPSPVEVGKKANIIIEALLEDGSAADLEKAEISCTALDPEIAGVTESGVVTGINVGTARFTVEVALEGVTKSCEITATVVESTGAAPLSGHKVIYNLTTRKAAWVNAESGDNQDIRDITYQFTDGNWEYHSYKPDMIVNSKTFYQYIDYYARYGCSVPGDWLALKLRVPAAGRYDASIGYFTYPSGGISEIYLIPADAESIADSIRNEYYLIGTLDYYDPEWLEKSENLGEITIPSAGEYFLVFKAAAQSQQPYFFLKQLKLNGAGPIDEVKLDMPEIALMPGMQITASAVAVLEDGAVVDPSEFEITFESSDTDVLTVTNDGTITAVSDGAATITVTLKYREFTRTGTRLVTVGSQKIRRSFYTDEKVATARENIKKYSWAESEMKSAVSSAEKYLGREGDLWNMVPTNELPRCFQIGLEGDPNGYYCPYCNTNLQAKYKGYYPWIINPLSDPWKIKCPDCKRRFPSNDFGSFYKTGLDENGNWRYDTSKLNGRQYLKNLLYPEKGEGWGVDDGYGYRTGETIVVNDKEIPVAKTFIAMYHHDLWLKSITDALESLKNAYLFTGEAKYGRAGAILIDRIADVYPEFDIDFIPEFYLSHGGTHRGKILGNIADYNMSVTFAQAYDAFWPAMNDSFVINFLSAKAGQYGFENPKSNAALIRFNCENGILREINKAVRDNRIHGNFGQHQQSLATAAVVLDSMPETKEWIDFCFKTGARTADLRGFTGGNIYSQLIDIIDRDGHGIESSPQYNQGWISNLMQVALVLNGYDKYPTADLFKHPKFIRMHTSMVDLTACSRFTPSIGDSGLMGAAALVDQSSNLLRSFSILKDPRLARQLYYKNGSRTDGLHEDIFTKDPESIVSEINKIIAENPAHDLKSQMLPGYGFAILRDGIMINDANSTRSVDTQRDFWMYFGRTNVSHAHKDKLNIGVHAYGLDLAPDLGYPEAGTSHPFRTDWCSQTISHNTILINDASQKPTLSANTLHFDDAGRVKVMDVDSPESYDDASVYRRTLVMVDADDDVSYGVDFFRVKGGNEHLYSFHALSNEASIEGVTLTPQNGGTYAGANVPYGEARESGAAYPMGYNWLRDVEKNQNPGTGTFSVDWKINDFHRVLKNPGNLHLRLTMLNGFNLSEVTLASGTPPRVPENPDKVKYLLARRSGSGLDSLFTSVIEPYKDERYIESMETVPVVKKSGTENANDIVRAVKVTLKNGREDYIVHATNNTVLYRVDNLFDFKGIVGVYSVKGEEIAYTYLLDGDTLGNASDLAPDITGTVEEFQKELSTDNFIMISVANPTDELAESLIGKYIYIDNDKVQNGCYEIKNAAKVNNLIKLDLGNTTLIRSYFDSDDFSMGYVYNIKEGQSFRIPLSHVYDESPVFEPLPKYKVDAKSSIRFAINAESPRGLPLTYSAVSLPRNASFIPETRTFSWVPEQNQLGLNNVRFKVSDGINETTITGTIEVFGSTSANTPVSPDPPKNGGDQGAGSGAGAGGGSGQTGGGTAGSGGDTDNENTDDSDITGFNDLSGYDWARDAVNGLASSGIIKGTGKNTYSPGAGITRADFTILLVRAFSLDGTAEVNFADVPEGAYYARELSTARKNGIITGMSGNMFNPTGNITREDMMVIIYRALELKGYITGEPNEETLNKFKDAGSISDYARKAAAYLIDKGFIVGSDNMIMPKKNSTRAEIAVLLWRIVNSLQ